MKFRTFLTTLMLFLFSFNLGILIISVTTFKDTLNRAEERSLGEHYFITSSLIKDFHAVESRGTVIEESLGTLLQPYSYLSGDKKAKLALYKDNQLVYSNRLEISLQSSYLKPPEDGSRLVSIQNSDGRTYINVSGKLPAPYDLYTMVYLYDTTDSISEWKQMKNLLFLVGSILSGLLALGLLLLLNRIFKPLSQISQTSRYIAAGAYETRLPVSGHDELSEMAQSFNHMAEEIQRQMTELITTAERKQQFIDNFAHELRTPLTAIYGYAEYMQKAALSEEDRLSAIDYIMSASRRLQTMANQLLELANLKNDQIAWEAQKVSDIFQAVKQTLHNKITEKGIQMEMICETDVIWGDASLLQSLFVNLIDNAIKACDTGGHIIVRATIEAGQKTVSIQDNGKGMTSEILGHITEPYYRAEKSRNRRDGGAGLGLAICKQIVMRHGAELAFMSHPGEGTIAKIVFTTSK
ncbi:HAMP domain-containing histidine kinase [Paenibacillus motobuensis]|uniref:HAMP domain-containing sensor histidine kinase n=1 Tax=Paenibacillus TaxID=44249 RepID=UPI00203F2EF0|nr:MULTISPECIES: HAMP domain-containing sensor histidine kinase [Paenibacillus]MCM3041509.1 HAMP domain-containing histidine kinase [Paenibacillus lutimineralis]MCM3648613.1 HAMP domain-containing histidine kinase [Paenibacillus motobuensis]